MLSIDRYFRLSRLAMAITTKILSRPCAKLLKYESKKGKNSRKKKLVWRRPSMVSLGFVYGCIGVIFLLIHMAVCGHICPYMWPYMVTYMTIYGHIYGPAIYYMVVYGHIWPYTWPYMVIFMAIYLPQPYVYQNNVMLLEGAPKHQEKHMSRNDFVLFLNS